MEQFALSMWLVQQKVQGKELPASLTPEMMPPSLRAKESNGEELAHSAEMDQISKEIELLVKEKRQLETEIAQKEADIKIKNSEIRSLQSELDTLTATLKQLEIQKREAQKRLDDLDTQVILIIFSHSHQNAKMCCILFLFLNSQVVFIMICYSFISVLAKSFELFIFIFMLFSCCLIVALFLVLPSLESVESDSDLHFVDHYCRFWYNWAFCPAIGQFRVARL